LNLPLILLGIYSAFDKKGGDYSRRYFYISFSSYLLCGDLIYFALLLIIIILKKEGRKQKTKKEQQISFQMRRFAAKQLASVRLQIWYAFSFKGRGGHLDCSLLSFFLMDNCSSTMICYLQVARRNITTFAASQSARESIVHCDPAKPFPVQKYTQIQCCKQRSLTKIQKESNPAMLIVFVLFFYLRDSSHFLRRTTMWHIRWQSWIQE